MADQDFVIEFRAETQAAISAMKALVAEALKAEEVINRVTSATGDVAGVGGLSRAAVRSSAALQEMGVDVEKLEARINKAFNPQAAEAFTRNIRNLPNLLGQIDLTRSAGQIVPDARIRQGIQGLRNLQEAFKDETATVERFQVRIDDLNNTRFSQFAPRLQQHLREADRGLTLGDKRLQINNLTAAERILNQLAGTGVRVDNQLGVVQRRLQSLNAPTSLRQEFERMLPTLRKLQQQASARGLLGDTAGQSRALRSLAETLQILSDKGVRVGRVLANVRAEISNVAGGARVAPIRQFLSGLGIDADRLQGRISKAFNTNTANAFVNKIRELPAAIGKIDVSRISGELIPDAQLRKAIAGFRGLQKVFDDDTLAVRRLQIEINNLNRTRVAQARPIIAQGLAEGSIKSLRAAERELKSLQGTGVNVNRTLADVKARLAALSAPGLPTVRQEIERIRAKLHELRNTISARDLLGNTSGQISALQKLQEELTKLGLKGVNVARNIAQVKRELDSLQNPRPLAGAQFRDFIQKGPLAKAREGVAVADRIGETGPQIRALRDLERALERLGVRGLDTARHLQIVKQRINELTSSAANTAAVERLLRLDAKNRQAISNRGAAGATTAQLQRGRDINLDLTERGYDKARAAVIQYRTALASLPQVYNAEISALIRQRDALLQSIRNREIVGRRPTATQLGQGVNVNQQLANAFAAVGDQRGFANATTDVERFSTAITANQARLNQWTSAFGTHARRVAEGLIIYNALGTALQGVASTISLVSNLTTELARFEAVAGDLSKSQAAEFIAGLGQVAVDTNTPLLAISSTADLVGASFREIENPVERADLVVAFQNLAGQFSNVTGRAGEQEAVTRELVSLYRQLGDPTKSASDNMASFSGFLDLVTTAGFNSSSVINDVAQGLVELGPIMQHTGADANLVAFALAEVTQRTGQPGREIGTVLRTVIANLADAGKVADAFEDINQEVVATTDSSGRLLGSTKILTNLLDAVRSGALDSATAMQVLQDVGPPLAPGSIGIIKELFDGLSVAQQRLQAESSKSSGALEELSNTIVNTLGGRFERIIRKLEVLISGGLFEPIVVGGEIAVTVIEALIEVLKNPFIGSLIASAAILTALGVSFLAVLKVISIVSTAWGIMGVRMAAAGTVTGRAAVAMRGLSVATGSTTASLAGVNATAGVTVRTMGALAGAARVAQASMTGVGTAGALTQANTNAKTLAERLGGVVGILGHMIKLAGIFAAIDLAASLPDLAGDITANLSGETDEILRRSRIQRDLLQRGFNAAEAPDILGVTGMVADWASLVPTDLTDKQKRSLIALAEKLTELRREGILNAEMQRVLEGVVTRADGSLRDEVFTVEDLDTALAEHNNTVEGGNAATEDATRQAEEYAGAFLDQAEAIDEATEAEQRHARALQENLSLSSARAAAIQRLTADLDAGRITLDEFNDGLGNIDSASQAAADFVAAFGDQLDLIPGLIERIASTGESPGEALQNMLLANPASLDTQIDIINRMIALVELQEEVATSVAETTITPRVDAEAFKEDAANVEAAVVATGAAWEAERRAIETNAILPRIDAATLTDDVGFMIAAENVAATGWAAGQSNIDGDPLKPRIDNITLLTDTSTMSSALLTAGQLWEVERLAIQANPITPRIDNGPLLTDAQRTLAIMSAIASVNRRLMNQVLGTKLPVGGSLDKGGKNASNDGLIDSNDAVQEELRRLAEALREAASITEGDPRLDDTTSREPAQTALLDVGDLPANMIPQLIAMAAEAQRRIVAAGGTVDTDEIVALLREGKFAQLVKGIDQRLLTEALQQLTDVEKKRLELEQSRLQDVTRSLVTQVGPIQSLVSAPVLSAGGGVLTGGGLNADPRLGNFTINVPINWSGMSLAQLQAFIYKSISQAWIQAGRGT